MTTKDNGGPAFPFQFSFKGPSTSPITGKDIPENCVENLSYEGMMLRDYFAAKAMVRIVFADKDGIMSPEGTAFASYRLADAMIAERAK